MVEFFLALFYLSGIVKAFTNVQLNLPFDLTLFSFIFCFYFLLKRSNYNLIERRLNVDALKVLLYLSLLQSIFLISLIYTRSGFHSVIKTGLFITNITGFIVPLISKEFNEKRFFKIVFTSVLSLSIVYLFYLYLYLNNTTVESSLKSISKLYLSLGFVLGANIVILQTKKDHIFSSKTDRLLLLLQLIVLLLIGARGPLLFSIISIVLFKWNRISKTLKKGYVKIVLKERTLKSRLLNTFLITSLVIGTYIFKEKLLTLTSRSLNRLLLLFQFGDSNSMGSSVGKRTEQIILSLKLIFNDLHHFIFGYGIGSFGVLQDGIDKRAYPHNIFLELWVEIGIIGVLLLTLLFTTIFSHQSKSKYITPFLVIYLILNSMKSNSIVDLRTYFILFGIFLSENLVTSKSQ